MIQIYDGDKWVGDLSASDFLFIGAVADKNKLRHTSRFINNGFTDNFQAVIKEVKTMDWPTANGEDEIANYLISILSEAKLIITLEGIG